MNSVSTVQSRNEEEIEQVELPSGSPESAEADTDTREDEATRISKDDLFHLLQNSRRRAVLRYLRDREGPVDMRELAEQVAAWEHDTTLEQLTYEERQRVYIPLYQSHLGKLADAGVIEYDKPRGVVEARPLLDYVASYMDAG
jgi:DNA-binding transcriptional ArsR family regulator